MPSIEIGYRKLYQAGGCEIQGQDKLCFEIPLKNRLTARVTIGPKPRFGIWIIKSEKYFLHTTPHQQEAKFFADATDSPSPVKLFTEIAIIFKTDVNRKIFAGLNDTNSGASTKLLNLAKKRAKELERSAEYVAGLLGVRVHRQFVLEPLNQNFVVDRKPVPIVEGIGDWTEIIDPCVLNQQGIASVPKALTQMAVNSGDCFESHADILRWLLRAWPERNPVLRFMAFFTAIECALGGVSAPQPKDQIENVNSLKELVKAEKPENWKQLTSYLNEISSRIRPSLVQRFRVLAEKAGAPTQEHDIEAFAKFNKIRNALVHRGDDAIKLRLELDQDQVSTLEDLSERYVSYSLFGDMNVYKSRHRPASAK
tara:strand:- start:1539 stop:2642 length:1104 start_codon:yes stop_codon:yes gene_type:complete